MASKQELIQAQRFSRRRLLTAFTSGAPGGRELEPAKPLRGVVLGIVLAVILAVGTLIVGTFTGTLPDGWRDSSVVIVKGEGTRYAVIEDRAYPVLNIASGRLATGAAEVLEVAPSDLDDVERVETPIGIVGAPDSIPAADRLIGGAWTACVTDTGVSTRLSDGDVPAPRPVADIVQGQDGTAYYVTGSLRHEIADPDLVPSLQVALQVGEPRTVPATWLNLLEPGEPLRLIEIAGAGDIATGDAGQRGLRVGQLVETTAGDGSVTGTYVVGADSRLVSLDPFELEIYRGFVDPSLAAPEQLSAAEAGPLHDEDTRLGGDDWPRGIAPESGDATCVRLDQTSDGARVTVSPEPEDLEPGAHVDPGRGAFVRATGTGGGQTWAFISDAGVYHALAGLDEAESLGYAEDDAVEMPAAWADLFETGPVLSREAAMSTHNPDQEE